MPKLSPLGQSDFKEIIAGNRYYVDKTAMIRAVWKGSKVQLHCRPRRFGKTLNLSMLSYFFDIEESHKHLFEGLAVAQDDEMMSQHQGKYPVIDLSFKDEKADDYPAAIRGMAQLLYREWTRHGALEGTLEYDKKLADMSANVRSGEIREDLFWASLFELSELLHGHYGAPVVLLIDEYDTPCCKLGSRATTTRWSALCAGFLARASRTTSCSTRACSPVYCAWPRRACSAG